MSDNMEIACIGCKLWPHDSSECLTLSKLINFDASANTNTHNNDRTKGILFHKPIYSKKQVKLHENLRFIANDLENQSCMLNKVFKASTRTTGNFFHRILPACKITSRTSIPL